MEASDIQYLKRHFHANNVILFLGAGFSIAAKNSVGETLPGSTDLARSLWAYMAYANPYDGTHLGIVYQAALNKPGGRKALFDLLDRTLGVAEFPDWYRLVINLFWYRIYTTNVDDLVELVYGNGNGALGLDRVIAPAEYEDRDAFLRTIQYVKLNGSVDDPEKGLTFSPIEYGRRASEQDVWYDHLVRDISTHPTLFVGSELDEPLFWQYLALRQRRSPGSGRLLPKSFLVCPQVSAAKREALGEFNIVPLEMSAEDFFTELTSQPDVVILRQDLLRNLDSTLEEVLALESAGVPSQEIKLAEEFFSVFRPVAAQPPTNAGRSHFLLGSPPSWDDIFNELDAEREVNSEVTARIIEELRHTDNGDGFVTLTGPAGSGKTTIAKRASIMVSNEGFPVYYATNFARLIPERIVSYLRRYERRVVLVFDETADDLIRIRELADRCRGLRHRPVILLTIRTNELAMRRYVFQGLDDLIEIRVPDLSEPDILAILERLERNALLGELRKLRRKQQIEVFRTKAKKQILVAMREATRGKGFDEIIQDEYDHIEPPDAKLVYLIAAIPSMHHYFIDRGQLIAAMDISPSQTSGIIDDTLRGILLPHENSPNRLQVRHPFIAEYVIRDLATREFLAQAYILFLEILAHDLPPQKQRRGSKIFRLYQNVINHTTLHSVFLKQVELCRRIYESIKPHFTDDGHYFLQYGSFELEWGDLDFAENYLMQAESLMPNHPFVATSLGYLWMRQGVEASSPLAATEYLNKGVERIQIQIETVGRNNPYPYHVLGSQMLAFINRWTPREERAKSLRDLHARIVDGSNRYPLDSQLKQLVEDIKRAELATAIS
jgi:SIR2-like protein